MSLATTTIFGLPFVSASLTQVVAEVTKPQSKLIVICTPNPEQVVLTQSNAVFRDDLLQADLLLPDGIGVVWASRLFALFGKSSALQERITGVDLVTQLLKVASEAHKKILVVGGRAYGVKKTAPKQDLAGLQALQLNSAALKKLGIEDENLAAFWIEGYRDITLPTKEEVATLQRVIETIHPDYIFVALGAPHQERWLSHFREFLQKEQVEVAMAVGGSFDILSGRLNRAPSVVQLIHAEWLYRLFQEPWRWRRQTKLLLFIKEAVLNLFQK